MHSLAAPDQCFRLAMQVARTDTCMTSSMAAQMGAQLSKQMPACPPTGPTQREQLSHSASFQLDRACQQNIAHENWTPEDQGRGGGGAATHAQPRGGKADYLSCAWGQETSLMFCMPLASYCACSHAWRLPGGGARSAASAGRPRRRAPSRMCGQPSARAKRATQNLPAHRSWRPEMHCTGTRAPRMVRISAALSLRRGGARPSLSSRACVFAFMQGSVLFSEALSQLRIHNRLSLTSRLSPC